MVASRSCDYRWANQFPAGEALFDVQQDKSRPFRIIGDVGLKKGRASTEHGTALAAGEAARVTSVGSIQREPVEDVAAVEAWSQPELVFEGASLEEVVAQFKGNSGKRFPGGSHCLPRSALIPGSTSGAGMPGEGKQAFVTAIELRYGRQLRRFLAARLRNASTDMPDLMQEVYLRLLRIEDHEAIRNPQAYLFTVASHVLHQHALRQATASAAEVLEVDLQAHAETDPVAETELEQAFELLDQSLRALSPRAYTTLVLSRCEGVPLKEIGRQFGVSRDQVKKYLARALIHVRQRLTDLNGGTD